MDCYVYFKTPEEKSAAVIAEVALLQQRLHALCPELQQAGMALQRRPELKQGLITWMEIYHQVPDNFEALLRSALQHVDFPELQYAERHAEYFVDVVVCA
ncbi:DUF4936 family protein [Undibacterium sp. CY7W]|uniref:DUF4936 family protein n=1 Tax=Undibacterium rugosum TaxID=2762291 RepID=A0A923IAX6_9BURK|nr:DUF4936 family protein [Undibacterium rugosum]MBC3935850.1 DUF4936 family protein [Undibacterium rugosum]